MDEKNVWSSRFFYIVSILALMVISFFWLRLQYLPQKNQDLNYYFNLAAGGFNVIGSIIAGVLLSREKNKSKQLFYFFMAVSLFLNAIAYGLWSYYNLVARIDKPYPSMADVFYLAATVFLGFGFWHYFDLLNIELTARVLFESIVVVIAVYIFLFFFIYRPEYDRTMPMTEIIMNYLYPLSDAFLLSLAYVVVRATQFKSGAVLSIFMGILLQVAGDILFTLRSAQGTYWNGDVSDYALSTSIFFLIIGIIASSTEISHYSFTSRAHARTK